MNKDTLAILGVNDIRNICLSKIYSDILELNEWNKRDCFYWLDAGNLVIINTKSECRFTFQITGENDFVCIGSAMIHNSMPF